MLIHQIDRRHCGFPDLSAFLDDNDSYRFFSDVGGGHNIIKTGHTGTNVMDIHLLAVVPKNWAGP
jgi:glycerate kinase